MGRTNKRSEAALNAATEMLATTKNPTLKAQLIKITLDYDLRQKEYAAKKYATANKAAGRNRSESKRLAGSPPNIQDLGENKQVSELREKLSKVEQALNGLRQTVTDTKQESEKARREIDGLQLRVKFTNEIAEQVASALPAEKHDKCAAELFHKFKSVASELLAKLLKSMGLNFETWRSWDDYYGENSELMVEAFAHPEKHERGKLGFLRLKLSELGIDVDAINAVRDYHDLKIDFAELEKRTQPHITFTRQILSGSLSIKSSIPSNLLPPLSGVALRIASEKLKSNVQQKLDWLQVADELLQHPDSEMAILLLKEIAATRLAAEKPSG
jgi:hypothetical protein